MSHSSLRRRLLLAGGLLPLIRVGHAAGQRAVIVGGGWGGLSLAAELRRLAPAIDILLIDRQPAFASFLGSNAWLFDGSDKPWPQQDYGQLAAARGYRFLQAEVLALDARGQRLHTSRGLVGYDWLVVSPGIREDFAAWGLVDEEAIGQLKTRYSAGLQHASELASLKARLTAFQGGTLLMSIPPLPYRCPPAPYERALHLAHWMKTRGIVGKLVIVDPNPIMAAFRKNLLERYRDQVSYLDHNRIHSVDLERRVATTDIEDVPFDEALLAPPQQAAEMLWQADLLRRSANGEPDGWGAQDAFDFHNPTYPGIFIIGDAAGVASPLFGYYPKTAHMAVRQGYIVARKIAEQAGMPRRPPVLPESVCLVRTGIEPAEAIRIETDYRRRGDGFLMQNVRQFPELPQVDAAFQPAYASEILLP